MRLFLLDTTKFVFWWHSWWSHWRDRWSRQWSTFVLILKTEVLMVIIRSKLHTTIDCIIQNKYLVYFVFVIMNNVLYMIQFAYLLLPFPSFSFLSWLSVQSIKKSNDYISRAYCNNRHWRAAVLVKIFLILFNGTTLSRCSIQSMMNDVTQTAVVDSIPKVKYIRETNKTLDHSRRALHVYYPTHCIFVYKERWCNV